MQNMRWQALGCEFDVIPRTVPQITALAQQIMSLKRMIRIHSNCTETKINPAGLPMEGIQIYNRQDHIRPVLGCFAVTDQRGIVGLVELQIVIAPQCRGCASGSG
jgi:hypothetical protein